MADAFQPLDELLDDLAGVSFDRPPAIVSNAHITGLSVSRALDVLDIPVIALDRGDGGVAYPSNAIDFAGQVTYPLDDLDGFADDIEAIVDAIGSEVVAFGCMDEWVHAYAETEPDGVVLPFAEHSTVDAVLNKSSLYRMADDLGVPYPETYRLDAVSVADVLERLEFPMVVKPELKREFEEAVGTNVIEVADEADLIETVEAAETHGVSVMVQERVPIEQGEDLSYVSYVPPAGTSDGDAMSVVGNPIVRYPRAFGTSCVVDRVSAPTVERHANAVLEAAGYYGISEAEFVFDRDRGEHVLLDVNTRPWKWISMPVAAGVNLPAAAYADAVGRDRPATTDEPRDMRWVYLRDYLALLAAGSDPGIIDTERWQAIIAGTFEGVDTPLTTGVYRPADPAPAAKLLEDEFAGTEYYCAC